MISPEYKAAFNLICEKLMIKVSREFRTMFGQGYFYIGQKEITDIAREQNREYLMLLLFESLWHSHKEDPLAEAKKVIQNKIKY